MKDVVGDQTETPLMTLLQGGAECLKAALGGEEGLRSVFFFFCETTRPAGQWSG